MRSWSDEEYGMANTNTLLVIGNGFDLYLGRKTSYKDYFLSDDFKEKREQLLSIYRNRVKTLTHNWVDSMTCWDILFWGISCIESNQIESVEDYKWCDIEMIIRDSLIRTSGKRSFDWISGIRKINNINRGGILDNTSDIYREELYRTIYSYFMYKKWMDDNKDDLYERLYEELLIFERQFGNYIKNQTSGMEYEYAARALIDNLKNDDRICMIDSFNYSEPCKDIYSLRHINGDYNNPIFGINMLYEEQINNSQICLFTKTSRRLRQDAKEISNLADIRSQTQKKVIVFGHSLNEQDFDYFSYIFTKLRFNTFDIEQMGQIEFVYSIYDENRKIEIANSNADAVYRILEKYESIVSNTNQHVLINLLRFSGKLRIREISNG